MVNHYRPPQQFWNAIPPCEKQRVVETALEYPEKSPRELAWFITDTRGYYISESTVYRMLKANDLVTSPIYTVVTAQDKFPHPTTAPNELWQTDFTWFKIVHWGWYYLCTILDDYSRYILAWQLCTGMSSVRFQCFDLIWCAYAPPVVHWSRVKGSRSARMSGFSLIKLSPQRWRYCGNLI